MSRPSRPGIKDVAAAAGVSPTTVSNALSGKGRLPSATRASVQVVADRLGYRPSALARGLRGQQMGLLGFVMVPASASSVSTVAFLMQLLTRAAEVALDSGHALVMLPADPDSLSPMAFPVDGVIVVDPVRDDPVLRALRRQRLPLVTVGRDLAGGPEPFVDDDQRAGTLELLQTVSRPGDRVVLITLVPRKSYLHDIESGLRAWAGSSSGHVTVRTVGSVDEDMITAVVRDMISEGLPDLIVGANDRITLSLGRALASAGLVVPSDVRLASMVGAPELELASCPITAVVPHPARLAELAVAALVELVGGDAPSASTLVPMDLAVRASAPRQEPSSAAAAGRRSTSRPPTSGGLPRTRPTSESQWSCRLPGQEEPTTDRGVAARG